MILAGNDMQPGYKPGGPIHYHFSMIPGGTIHSIFSPMDVIGIGFMGMMGVVYFLTGWRQKKDGPIGGTGKVVGIVGRMGSGKSYFAVKMAYNRLLAGSNVCTNFTMKLKNHDEDDNCLDGVKYKVDVMDKRKRRPVIDKKTGKVRQEWRTHRCQCSKIKGNWRQFSGWDDFATLENAVVIIDEAHLYAPSNKAMVFPQSARFKLSQARKFELDVYWITQHEARVNSVLKDLTNFMYLCKSYSSGLLFTAVGWEPESFRRKSKHLDRMAYRLRRDIASAYDTLQILDFDEHLASGKEKASMDLVRAVKDQYNAKRGYGATGGARLVQMPTAAPPRGARLAQVAVMDPPQTDDPGPVVATRPARCPCVHEQRAKKRTGWCQECGP